MNQSNKAAAHLATLGVYTLANLADCSTPDAENSAGGELLDSVRTAVIESVNCAVEEYPELLEDMTALAEHMLNLDCIHEIADAAPSIYTYARWQQFTDLAAWQEDISDYADGTQDMETLAGYALYAIAERLVVALFNEIREAE